MPCLKTEPVANTFSNAYRPSYPPKNVTANDNTVFFKTILILAVLPTATVLFKLMVAKIYLYTRQSLTFIGLVKESSTANLIYFYFVWQEETLEKYKLCIHSSEYNYFIT